MIIKNADKPVLILDVNRCKRNIERIAAKAELHNCEFRPHFKTHQSKIIGRWFRESGVTGITVSSPEMAHYFAEDGWDDITIAFPFYTAQLKKLKELEKLCKLRLFVTSEKDLAILDKELNNPFTFMIEVDSGYGRSGLPYTDKEYINSLIESSKSLDSNMFKGFYIHDGRTYSARNKNEIISAIQPSLYALEDLKKHFPEAKISIGDTPSATVLDNLDFADEITPGNLVFFDWMQVQIGSCSVNDVSLFAQLPIAQNKPNNKNVIIHGGAVHLSKDFIEKDGDKNFGQVVNYFHNGKIEPIEKSWLTALSQEHGTLNNLPTDAKDYITVIPIHSCLTANLFDHYITTDGQRIEKRVLS